MQWARSVDQEVLACVDAAAETELVNVRVQAPCWVDVDTLEVWVDGEMRESIDIAPDGGCTTLRFDDDVMVPVAAGAGSWVVFHAKGDMPLGPVTPGAMPFGVTNPIYLDGDGDAIFEPLMAMP